MNWRLVSVTGWLLLALATFGLAVWGWALQADAFGVHGWRGFENALYMTLRVFSLNDSYAAPDKIGARWQLVAARWGGALVFLSGVFTAGMSLFRAQLAAFIARLRNNHFLIVGDHDMAHALVRNALTLGLPVVHVTSSVSQPQRSGFLINLPRRPEEDPMTAGRADRATRVIIAEVDLGESAESALGAAERYRSPPGAPAKVAVHLDDPATAERIHHAEGGIDLFAFSEAHAAARSVMSRHPPFLLAHRIGAPAAHILIWGFDALGQEIARDLILNGLGMDLRRPWITVVDEDAARAKRDFLHRHPEFLETSRFEVFPHLEDAKLDDLAGAPRGPTVCAAYICLRDSAAALSAAIGLRERAVRHDFLKGPIFVRLRSGGLMRAPGGVEHLRAAQLYGFGGLPSAAAACRALLADPDETAREVHESYSSIGGGSAQPWATLPEELRVSNRRVASHIPAKLATMGFDLEPWLALPDESRPWPPPLAPGERLCRDDADRTRLAALEHERWIMDRRLNGWRQGKTRDNSRKIHTDFVPFAELSETVRSYDYQVIDWMDRFLPRRPGGLVRRPGTT